MTAPVDVHGILGRAGANPDAPAGSQAWALELVDAAVAEMIEAAKLVDALYPLHWDTSGGGALIMPERVPQFEECFDRLNDALARVGAK